MYIWGKGRAAGRVGSGQTFCRQSRVGSGRVNVSPGRVGSKKSDPRGQLWSGVTILSTFITICLQRSRITTSGCNSIWGGIGSFSGLPPEAGPITSNGRHLTTSIIRLRISPSLMQTPNGRLTRTKLANYRYCFIKGCSIGNQYDACQTQV